MKLEQSLILTTFLAEQIGYRDAVEARALLSNISEGRGGDASSFVRVLASLKTRKLPEADLETYDARLVNYEDRIARRRDQFRFKYFQYLCLLHIEMFLDRATRDPRAFVTELNVFLRRLKQQGMAGTDVPDYSMADLRRLALFMAMASGKTILMHVNLWQFAHYLEYGRQANALVDRPDGRRAFDSILLITPSESLSQQHMDEFRKSGVDAGLLTRESGASLLRPQVEIIDIHKLAEVPSRKGVSILLDDLGSRNLVFVDEGHKGTGSEAQTWKTRQRRLSADGFLVEYSATFTQAIAATPPKQQRDLLAEYGKAIVFDFSYRHYYMDGYGKDFRVLNLAKSRDTDAERLLVGGLLAYYQQRVLYRRHRRELAPFNIALPLWIFVGSSVNAVFARRGGKTSDVATVVKFLQRFLQDGSWARKVMQEVLDAKSGFSDSHTHDDLFADFIVHLRGNSAGALYPRVCNELFGGSGGLELWEIRNAPGEFGLKVTSPVGRGGGYFGVITIGDGPVFKKYLQENAGVRVLEDRIASSPFADINQDDSPITVLIGAKRFIEGWSSWRVSTMGLLNLGRSEGSQIVQLFGRGVRLKGLNTSLKRTGPEIVNPPPGLHELETLNIFGWNADYVQEFRRMLEDEDVGEEMELVPTSQVDRRIRLLVPRPPSDVTAPITELRPTADIHVSIDLGARVFAMRGAKPIAAAVGSRRVDFSRAETFDVLEQNELWSAVLRHKARRGYSAVSIKSSSFRRILESCDAHVPQGSERDPGVIQEVATRALTTYLDRCAARDEREYEGSRLVPSPLVIRDELVPYRLRITDSGLLSEIKALLANRDALYRSSFKVLPRLHIKQHLFSPLLVNPSDHGIADLAISPTGLRDSELRFMQDVHAYWAGAKDSPGLVDQELFVLRNVPGRGVGFFRRSGFFPDFLVWLRERKTGDSRLVFVEPHGLHHGGLAGNRDKIDALVALPSIGASPEFAKVGLRLSGCLLTDTTLAEIPDASGRTWTDLWTNERILRQEGDYIPKALGLAV